MRNRTANITWVPVVGAQRAEAGVGQRPQLILLEGPAQLGQEVLQGDALGEGQARTDSDMGGVPPT